MSNSLWAELKTRLSGDEHLWYDECVESCTRHGVFGLFVGAVAAAGLTSLPGLRRHPFRFVVWPTFTLSFGYIGFQYPLRQCVRDLFLLKESPNRKEVFELFVVCVWNNPLITSCRLCRYDPDLMRAAFMEQNRIAYKQSKN